MYSDLMFRTVLTASGGLWCPRSRTTLPPSRIGVVEVLFDVRVAALVRVCGAVLRCVRIEAVTLLPVVRHAVVIAVGRRGGGVQLGPAADLILRVDDALVAPMPMDTLFGIMAVSLNASESLGEDIVVGLHLTDLTNTTEPADYTMHLRRGILEVQPQIPDNPEFTITTESLVWKNVALGKLDPVEAVSNGDIIVHDADPGELYSFLEFFN